MSDASKQVGPPLNSMDSQKAAHSPSSKGFWYLHRTPFKCCVWHGPVNLLELRHKRNTHIVHQRKFSDYGLTWAVMLHQTRRFRLDIVAIFPGDWHRTGATLSMNWHLSWPRILQYDSRLVDIALRGDVEAMRGELASGRSDPFGVLGSGKSLLHVCSQRLLN